MDGKTGGHESVLFSYRGFCFLIEARNTKKTILINDHYDYINKGFAIINNDLAKRS